ncbi:autotransporter outer membrane beta-barrel domain-containing protein [Sutterella sp.]|uniref:autotransporter outer membrane beta-barrel domain-containing protein n=1 Tax=Sutterella sp. TaxID=1981025 RepID=UPI0026E0EF3A|nr:autotransporter outer membrane beta-barrel domain-containing protein [Sutterella sp.]MDO5531467.1 autotransporter outer membrane beta-barrel domain-containing protein [Sutterella sp.]
MNKASAVAVAVAMAWASAASADQTIANQNWTSAQELSYPGETVTFAAPTELITGSTKWHAALYMQGATGSITADTLEFAAQNAATGDPNSTPGYYYNAAYLAGNSSLTIDVGTLLVGTRESSDETGGDRGFRLAGTGNSLQIYADRIVSYTGDEFVHVREGAGSVANIGSADRRVSYFEAHTGWGKGDYGVAILQANEGGEINLYADTVILDGSSYVYGGVIGSGGWGTVNVDAKNLTIDGNICGSYGTMSTADKTLALNVKAETLTMTGDVNLGSAGSGYSNYERTTVVSITADTLAITGDINVVDNGRSSSTTSANVNTLDLTVNTSGSITGTINASQANGTSTVNLGGSGDMTASSGKYSVSNGATVNFKDSGSWTVNSWEGTDGNLSTADSVKVAVNSAVEVASATIGGSSVVTLNDGAKLTAATLTGEGGTILVNTADAGVISAATNATASADALSVTLSAAQNDSYATAAEAAAALAASAEGLTGNYTKSGEEGAVSDAWTVAEDGTVTATANQKLAGYGTASTLSVFSWRHELNNLQKRMGEIRDLEGSVGAWARVYGTEHGYNGRTNKNTTIQIGADVAVNAWTVGGAFSYTDGSVDSSSLTGDNKSYTFTGYGIWQHENGSYLDITARYSRLEADFTSGVMSGSYDNNAWSFSAEAGHKFSLTELAFVEPQIEVIYGRVVGDDFTTTNGTRISQEDYDSLIGRLGARAGFNFPEQRGNLYARFSVVHDFEGELETTATNGTSRTIRDDIGGTWVEYGIGGNFRITPNSNVFVDLERTSGGDVQEKWRWTVGARMTF